MRLLLLFGLLLGVRALLKFEKIAHQRLDDVYNEQMEHTRFMDRLEEVEQRIDRFGDRFSKAKKTTLANLDNLLQELRRNSPVKRVSSFVRQEFMRKKVDQQLEAAVQEKVRNEGLNRAIFESLTELSVPEISAPKEGDLKRFGNVKESEVEEIMKGLKEKMSKGETISVSIGAQ